jgi:hypothetical protein
VADLLLRLLARAPYAAAPARVLLPGEAVPPAAPAPTACASEPLEGYQHGGGFIPCEAVAPAAPAPGSSRAVILQDGAVPVLNFKPGRFDGPYVAGDGIDLWSFSSEAAALSYSQALRREGAEPVALAENALGPVAAHSARRGRGPCSPCPCRSCP